MQRWIIHVDMDAFYAAVEQHDHKELAGMPVIVGGLGSRGVVSTASYEARAFGVHSAMPMAEARRRCPHGVFLPGDHARYSEVSARIMAILSGFSPIVEPLSLDEAFLDVSGMAYLYPDLEQLAGAIKRQIRQEVGLVASVGMAENKFLAKLASDFKKPDGLMMISPGKAAEVLENMPVSRVWGVGAATGRILLRLGIRTIGELSRFDVNILLKHCGNLAYQLHSLANGRDDRVVIAARAPQSIGKELTFGVDLTEPGRMKAELLKLAEKVGWRLRRSGYSGRTVTVKIRYASFRTITRSCTLEQATNFDETIYQTGCAVLDKCNHTEGIRLLGITVSNLQSGSPVTLFEEGDKRQALYSTVDRLRSRFGEAIITKAQLLR